MTLEAAYKLIADAMREATYETMHFSKRKFQSGYGKLEGSPLQGDQYNITVTSSTYFASGHITPTASPKPLAWRSSAYYTGKHALIGGTLADLYEFGWRGDYIRGGYRSGPAMVWPTVQSATAIEYIAQLRKSLAARGLL